jgi:hypothetical protein
MHVILLGVYIDAVAVSQAVALCPELCHLRNTDVTSHLEMQKNGVHNRQWTGALRTFIFIIIIIILLKR